MRRTVWAFVRGAVARLLRAAVSGPTWAKNYDQVKPVVSIPDGEPVPSVKVNEGTSGTIQLWYPVTASSFPVGAFAQFTLCFSILPGTPGDTTYPATLTLYETGSPNLVLAPASPSFPVTGSGWTGSTRVTVSIQSGVAGDPTLTADGAVLGATLQMVVFPVYYHLDTPSAVQVHLTLVHPTA